MIDAITMRLSVKAQLLLGAAGATLIGWAAWYSVHGPRATR